MCGIAGLMTRDGTAPPSAVMAALRDALVHRGPDGSGHYARGDVAMVQTRLAIIDLATGDQPLYEPGGAALVANGEIYNYRELRAQMPDAAFATQSDCEPPLHLYRRQGIGFTDRLRGMYAIALHDPTSGSLVLARDPFGIKPLYYVEGAFGLAFASEPQALIAAGLATPAPQPGPRNELLQLQFTTGRETIHPGISRVLPGETVVLRAGRIVETRRRVALPAGAPVPRALDAALTELERVLVDSLTMHQRSDVPYGLFLSGGIDSATLLALMARLNDRPVRAFTVGFTGGDAHDERAHAEMLARRVGAEHVALDFGPDDFWNLLPAVAAAMDDPAADYAILPTWKLAQVASRELKVVLCGEGGDELFAGYGRYRSALRPWWRGGKAMRPRGALDGLDVLRDAPRGWRDGISAAEAGADAGGRSRLQVAQAVDCADWLPNDLLTKLDRCLMAHGLEGRTPFLDPVVAEFAFRLPDGLKIRDGRGKYLLRRLLERLLPEARPFSPKRGFTVPVGAWIASRGRALGQMVARQPDIAAIAHPDRVVKLFEAAAEKRAGQGAWILLFYALWHRAHVRRQPVAPDVFAALGN